MYARKILFLTLSLMGFGFGADAADAVNVSGHYKGVNYTSEVPGPNNVIINLTQEDNSPNIIGYYWIDTGVGGKGVGTMTGANTFHIDWVNTTQNCKGSYSNDYIINGDQITWTFSGKDCLGIEKGHGYASK